MQIVYVILIGLILAEIIKLLEPTGILFVWIFQHISSIVFALIMFIVLFALAIVTINYFKYKDETEEERAERLKRQEILDKWRKQFK